jgi:hypothetical protein
MASHALLPRLRAAVVHLRYTHRAVAEHHFVRIVGRDKDLLQLVSGDDVLMCVWVCGCEFVGCGCALRLEFSHVPF